MKKRQCLTAQACPLARGGEDALIRVWDLNFAYGAVPVLEAVNLEIGAGEFLGIVGPNAGGKSTLLKLILGLLEPQSGRIRVLGHPPAAASRLIGYVPQYPSFPRDFPITVEQAVLLARIGGIQGPLPTKGQRADQSRGTANRDPLPGWFAGLRPGGYSGADRAAARQALAEVEAEDLARRRIGSLSGGQLQRVLLARALAGEPRILILDEPTANIDQRLEGDIFDLLRRLNQRLTILVVSHDIGFISSYVGRVACVNRTLICHRTDAVDGQIIRDLYGESVRMVAHRH